MLLPPNPPQFARSLARLSDELSDESPLPKDVVDDDREDDDDPEDDDDSNAPSTYRACPLHIPANVRSSMVALLSPCSEPKPFGTSPLAYFFRVCTSMCCKESLSAPNTTA